MAKKAKSKSFFAKQGNLLAVLVAVLVALTILFPGVIKTFENADPTMYKGFELAFGKSIGTIDAIVASGDAKIKFSIVACLAYFLPLVLTVLMAILVKNRPIGGVIMALGFIASAVLMFLMPSVTSLAVTAKEVILGSTTTTVKTFAELEYALGYGSIIGGSLSIVGALTSLAYGFVK